MKAGRHDVLYQAADADGNKARCVFTVTVWDSSKVNPKQERRWVIIQIGSILVWNWHPIEKVKEQ